VRDLARFDPIARELADDFWPTLEEMRVTCPVLHSEAHGGLWVLTRYQDRDVRYRPAISRGPHELHLTFEVTA
jgi:hypothetical protein